MLKSKKEILTLLFSLLLVGMAADAYALDMEFYTYGGFDAVSTAFNKLALIFSDSNYKALFFSVIVAGILFGGMAAYVNLLRGGRGGALAWLWPIGIGVVIYLGLIVPKGKIIVSDPVLNKFETINNIPNGVVAIAGILSKIEDGIVTIIDTSATPSSYKDYGFSTGFDMLLKAVAGKPTFGDPFLDATMHNYEEDCLFFALQNASTSGLTTRQLSSESTDFFTEYEKAENNAVYTTVVNAAHPDGETQTCTEAWHYLHTELSNATNLKKLNKFICSRAGYKVDDVNQLNKCEEVIETFFGEASGIPSLPSTTYIRQVYMAQSLENTIKTVDPDFAIKVLSSRGLMEKGVSTGMIMNEWIPVMRAVVTAIVIGLIPVLVIFLPTPLFGKVVTVGCGMFLWITMWGITDAVVHSVVYEYGMRAFEIVKQNNLGLAAIMYTPGVALKALSMAGMCRGTSVLLATVLTGSMIKFGGYAFTSMMGGMMGGVGAAGAIGAAKTMEPQSFSKEVSGLRAAPTTMANPYKVDYNKQAGAEAKIATSRAQGQIDAMKQLGAWDANRQSTMSGLSSGAGRGSQIEAQGLEKVLGADIINAKSGIGKAYGTQRGDNIRGQDVGTAAFEKGEIQELRNLTGAKAQESELRRVANERFGGDIGKAQRMQSNVKAGGEMGLAEAIGTKERSRDRAGAEIWNKYRRSEKYFVDSGVLTRTEHIHANRGGNEISLDDAQMTKHNQVYGTHFKGGGLFRLAIDSNGNPVLANVTRGKEDVNVNREQDFNRDIHQSGSETIRGERTTQYGWAGSFGGVGFASAVRTDLSGGRSVIEGTTSEGHDVRLAGQTEEDGTETIIKKHTGFGPDYTGAFALAGMGQVPKEVFHDPVDAGIFATKFGTEHSGFYKGTMSKQEALNFAGQGGLSGETPKLFGIKLSGSAMEKFLKGRSQVGSADVMTFMANGIATGDGTDAQKQRAMRGLHDMATKMKVQKSGDVKLPRNMIKEGKELGQSGATRGWDDDNAMGVEPTSTLIPPKSPRHNDADIAGAEQAVQQDIALAKEKWGEDWEDHYFTDNQTPSVPVGKPHYAEGESGTTPGWDKTAGIVTDTKEGGKAETTADRPHADMATGLAGVAAGLQWLRGLQRELSQPSRLTQ